MQVAQGENLTLSSDDMENDIRTSMPRILEILLLDRTTSTPKTPKNIIWANDNYIEYGASAYAATAQIKPELITGTRSTLIMPRVSAVIASISWRSTSERLTIRSIS